MRRILSEEDHTQARPWRRFFAEQFAVDRTTGQRVFDVFFGVVAPVLCFYADPVVFRSGGFPFGSALFGGYQLFAYLISAMAIVTLVIWLCLEKHLAAYSSLIGGVFLSGAVFSLIIGVIILPFSLLGLLVIIGVAGFTPFVTAFVYFRNCVKAFHRSSHRHFELQAAGALLAASVAIGVPVLINYQVTTAISQSVEVVLKGDSWQAEAAVDRLNWIPFIPEETLDSVAFAYRREQDVKKKQILKKYYLEATGRDIEWRLRVLDD